MTTSECPGRAELLAFHRGELPTEEIDRIGAHLEGCPRCEADLQSLDLGETSVAAALRDAGEAPEAASTLGGKRRRARGPGRSGRSSRTATSSSRCSGKGGWAPSTSPSRPSRCADWSL